MWPYSDYRVWWMTTRDWRIKCERERTISNSWTRRPGTWWWPRRPYRPSRRHCSVWVVMLHWSLLIVVLTVVTNLCQFDVHSTRSDLLWFYKYMYALIFMNLMKFIVSEIRELNRQKLIINEYWWNSSMLVHKLFTIRSLCQSYNIHYTMWCLH